MSATKLLLNPEAFKLKGSIQLGSNGANAKSAPVTLIANSGEPIEYPGVGRICWDFETMTHKPRIPLDYEHRPDDSDGYLNKISTDGGVLKASGALIITDEFTAALATKMESGVPYEASIESHGGTLELIDEGEVVVINGRPQTGPFFALREWKLAAVAICKFGKDSDTSAELVLSAAKKNQTKRKVTFVSSANEQMGEEMDQSKQVAAVEAAEAVVTEEVKPVQEAKATEATVTGVVPQAEADKAVEAIEDTKAEVEAVTASKQAVEVSDPRAEFKQFVAAFGDKAAEYFGEGLSLSDATTKFVEHLKQTNDELTKRLAASVSDRGADKPVAFSDESQRSNAKRTGLPIRLASKK